MTYNTIICETGDNIGVITLNRPDALNALSTELRIELGRALEELQQDESVGAIIITGNGKAFAAGADIKEMQDKSYMDMYFTTASLDLERTLSNCCKPVIAAVNGFALGGGCELAMMCDFILASERAKFGQPEVNIGVLPGWGGTQRLTGLVGKSKAMDMCLTGRMMDAEEAERAGLVSRVFPAESLMDEARTIAMDIASKSVPAISKVRECVNQSLESGLRDGLLFERRQFQAAFATEDQKEGMAAFVEKRRPEWKHR